MLAPFDTKQHTLSHLRFLFLQVCTSYYVLLKTSIGKTRFPVTIASSLVLISIPFRQPECHLKNTSLFHTCVAWQHRKGNQKPQTCVSGLSITNLGNVLTLEMALNMYLYLMNDDQDTVNHIMWLRKSHELMSGMPFLVRYDSKESRRGRSSSTPMTKFILNQKRSKLKAKINPSLL